MHSETDRFAVEARANLDDQIDGRRLKFIGAHDAPTTGERRRALVEIGLKSRGE